MNILIVGNLAPYRVGGAEVQARLLASRFARRKHRVVVAGYGNPRGRQDECDERQGQFETMRLWRSGRHRIIRALTYALSLAVYLLRSRNQFDVILCYMLGESDMVISLLKRLNIIDLPLVVCSAGFGPGGDAARLRALPMASLLMRMHERQCNAVNIISPEIRKELAQLGYARKFVFIPNGVPLPRHQSSSARFADGRRSFLFVGRLVGLKGCADLLEAVRLLKGSNIPFSVNIVGDGPEAASLRMTAAAHGLDDRVTFHGLVHPDRMVDHYLANTILVLPSHREAQGMVVAEAMSFGLPVIVTRSGGPEFTVDDSMALTCPKGDPAALAAAMRHAIQMPEDALRAMGENARRHVRDTYDIEKVADRFIGLICRLVSGRGI